MPSMSKPFRFIYVIATTVLVALALEGAVRLFRLAPPVIRQYVNYVEDPYLPFKPRPMSIIKGRSAYDEFDFEYRHSSLGFRDTEHTFSKPPGVFRILGLGDSFAYGDGVPFEETFLYRLEQSLNERPGSHPVVEIIKAGIPRYWPEPQRLLLAHYGVKFHPDLILVGFFKNDLTETALGMDSMVVTPDGYLKGREAERLGGIGTWSYLHSHLYRIVSSKFVSYRVKGKVKASSQGENWKKVEAEYQKMAAVARSVGAKVVFICIPEQADLIDGTHDPCARLSRWCERENYPFIDMSPAMKKASLSERLYWEKDGRCNSAGHKVIAGVLFGQSVKRGLVP